MCSSCTASSRRRRVAARWIRSLRRSWRTFAALTADELVRASGLDPGEGAAALMELELAGEVMLEDGVYRAAV